MGGFYTNYTLRGPSQQAVSAVLKGRRALVTDSHNGCVVAFDEISDQQDQEQISELAARLSRELACPVLAVLDHDDDILWYQLYISGKRTDEYHSWPGYFDRSADPSASSGGDAEQLCAAFGARNIAAVEQILRKSSAGDNGYVFAHERHADLVRSLGLPEIAVGTAYASFACEEYPEGLPTDSMLRAAGEPAAPTPEEKQRERDLEFYDRLGPEDSSRRCKHAGCTRGAISLSVMCRRHHFEMIQQRNCPFDH
jgi:hypothetical protein